MEERIIFSKSTYSKGEYESTIVANFIFNDTHVYTNNDTIIFESVKKIDLIDGTHEINRYIRPDVITIQGIFCFFTGYPFTIYEKQSDSSRFIGLLGQREIEETKLIIDETDYSTELQALLMKLNDRNEKSFIISLLDRWRKAQFMIQESNTNTYHDEAILNFFHILELVVSQHYDNFKDEAVNKINSFVSNYVDDILLLRGSNSQETKNSKSRILKEILLTDAISISTKINYFLKHYGMLDDQTYALVNRLKDVRNAIAHGRIVFKDKLIWPLPPFFFLTNESPSIITEISVFTVRAIDLVLGLNVWKEEWENIHRYLLPTTESIRKFISDKPTITPEDLFSGSYHHVTPLAIIDYYIKNPKKVTVKDLEEIFKATFEEVEPTQENSFELLMAAIAVSDSEIEELSILAKGIVECIVSNDLHGFSNIKDALHYLNYYGINPIWFRDYLENR